MAKGKGRLWTEAEYQHLANIVKGRRMRVLAELMTQRFQQPYTVDQIKGAMARKKLTNGLDGRFTKGQVSWNKGKHFNHPGSRPTQFKKGGMPHNSRPVGSEQVRDDGYLWIKTADPRTWRPKHRMIWEEAHGSIPDGHVVVFLNQDRTDFRLDNLALVSRKRLAVANKHGLMRESAELTRTGLLIVDVKIKARQLKNKRKEA